jgi:hypothetical protein
VRFRVFFTFGLALFAAVVPAMARAEEPALSPSPAPAAPAPASAPATDLPPPGARVSHIVAGAATTGVAYGLAVGASYLYEEPDFRGSKDLRIPIAGPWMALGKTGCPTNDPDCSPVILVIGAILTVFDGVAQAGGLGIIGEGLFLNTSSGRPAPRKAQLAPTVRAVPFHFEKGGVGLGVVGTF